MRCFLLLVAVFSSVVVQAEAVPEISTVERVPNVDPGYCSFCCLEMIGNHQQITALQGLLKQRIKSGLSPGGSYSTYESLLKRANLNYWIQDHGVYSTEIFEEAKKLDRPVMVSLSDWPIKGGNHAVLVLDLNEQEVVFMDPNHTETPTRKSREWFRKYWNGLALFIFDGKEN